jgi:predicted XRE-type DNA-binding protein
MSKDDDFALVHGSGNVFRDFGYPDAEILQFKTLLAAKIIEVLDTRRMTVRRAQELTGYAAADFSRVRRARIQRFTIERLIGMLRKLEQDVELSVRVRPRARLRSARLMRGADQRRPSAKATRPHPPRRTRPS